MDVRRGTVAVLTALLVGAGCGAPVPAQTPATPSVPPVATPAATADVQRPTPLGPSAGTSADGSSPLASATATALPASPTPVHTAAPSGAPGSPSPVTGGLTDEEAARSIAEIIPADYLTAAADPLNLTPQLTPSAAVTRTIDAHGGAIVAVGADGTEYTLTLPSKAVPIPTAITMTPIAAVAGMPADAAPEHYAGVQLEPSGLELARIASLTIRPPDLPIEGVAALDYRASGRDAGVMPVQPGDGQITLEVEHFSGYVLAWPIKPPEWRSMARAIQENQQRAFLSMLASALEYRRGFLLAGGDPDSIFTERQLAENQLPEFVEKVIRPRFANAAFGCQEANDAVQIWLAYWRSVQQFGVVPDPNDPDDENAAFALVLDGQTYYDVFDFPERLLATLVDHCFREAYLRCVETGDFPGLFVPLFTLERFVQLLGRQMEQAWYDLAIGYAKRCGHWQVNVTTNIDEALDGKPCCGQKSEVRRIVTIDWKPSGPGLDGIIGATWEGAADPRLTSLSWNFPSCPIKHTTPRVLDKATVKIKAMAFRSRDENGEAIVPVPTQLTVLIGPPYATHETAISVECPNVPSLPLGAVQFDELQVYLALKETGAVGVITDEDDQRSYLIPVERGWQFRRPYAAHTVLNGTFASQGLSVIFARLEVLLMHKPQ